MSTGLETLLQHPGIWQGRSPAAEPAGAVASGFPDLDRHLPGGGWLRGALTEFWLPRHGVGELALLMPMLARLSHERRWIALIRPPHIPYAPAWQAGGVDITRLLWVHPKRATEELWAIEQGLRMGTCSAVLAWPGPKPTFEQLRRLQLAAEAGNSLGLLFHTLPRSGRASPAAVVTRLQPGPEGLRIELLKRRGAWGGDSVNLPLAAALQ